MSAKADYFLEFKPRTAFTPGSSSIIDIVLRETRSSGTSDLGTFPAISGNLRFTWTGSSAYSVTDLKDHEVQEGRAFDNGGGAAVINLDPTLKFGTVEQFDLIPTGSIPSTDPGYDSWMDTPDPIGTVSGLEATLRLGSFVLSGGSANDSIRFVLVDFGPGADIVLDDGNAGLELDNLISYGDFEITAIPEPSSFLALGLFATGFAAIRSRKKKTAV